MKEEIIVLVDKDGAIQTEARGIKGKECIALTEFISALGDSTRTLKGEYFQSGKTKIAPHLRVHNRQETPKEPA